MTIEEKIQADYITALKAGDKIKVSTIRFLKADINNVKLDQNKKSLTDDEIINVIKRQIKRHKESIGEFEKGKRADLVEKETKELEILKSYMPEEMPEDELKIIINETIAELGASSKKDMGKVIKSVMDKVKGKADGKIVSQIVSSILP